MNELFIQENYISYGVEHVRVTTIPSGVSQTLEKHDWGCKIGNAIMYGHVQIKTLLGHVVDEHKGKYADKSLKYDVVFPDLMDDFDHGPFIQLHGFYYHEPTQTLYVQCYKSETVYGEEIRTKLIPYVRVFRILSRHASMVLYSFNENNSIDDRCDMYITPSTIVEVSCRNIYIRNVSGYMVGKINGAVEELETIENTSMIPLVVEDRVATIRYSGHVDAPRLRVADRVELLFDPEKTKENINFDIYTEKEDHRNYSHPILELIERPIYYNIDRDARGMILVHDVVEVKTSL